MRWWGKGLMMTQAESRESRVTPRVEDQESCFESRFEAASEIGFPVMIKASEGGGRAYGWFPKAGTCMTHTSRCAVRCRDRQSSS
jgi:pyruvate carboxylase